MSRYAITDIHGCRESFMHLLAKIDFKKKDELFLLGDYIDRGPDSKGVLDDIFQLKTAGYKVHCLRGNHEEGLLHALIDSDQQARWIKSWGGQQTLDSFPAQSVSDIPTAYFDFMQNLPYHIELEDYILVHAGLDFSKENPLEDKQSMIWIRRWKKDVNKDWLQGKIIVHGHTPISRWEIEVQKEQVKEVPVLNIDGGCAYKAQADRGYLVALALDTQELYFQRCTDAVVGPFS